MSIISNYFLSHEHELTLLGNWLQNMHREEISIFDPCIFEYKTLFNAIRKGKSFEQIVADNELPCSYVELYEHIGAEYWEARAEAIRKYQSICTTRLETAEDSKTKYELIEKYAYLQAVLENKQYKKKATDLAKNFLEELKQQESESAALFGKGFKKLDGYTNGIHRGQLIVLGARPATGKSAMALQMAYNVSKQGHKVLFIPLEMTTHETIERMLLQQQILDAEELKKPTQNRADKIIRFLDDLEQENNFIIYEGLTELDGIIEKVKQEKPYLIVVDQLTQVRTATKNKDIREKYTEITSKLKELAINEKVAVLLLTQLNREATKTGKPSIENLHEADSTGQNADLVLIITKDNETTAEEWKDINLYIAKQRQGNDNITIPLKYKGDRYTFIPVL